MFQNQSYALPQVKSLGAGGGIGMVGITYTHYCIKQMVNENILYSTGKSTQQCVVTYMGKKKGMDIFICITDSLCCTPETNIPPLRELYSKTTTTTTKSRVTTQGLQRIKAEQQPQLDFLPSFLPFCLLRATPTAYAGSQARAPIRVVATSLHHIHSNWRSDPRL